MALPHFDVPFRFVNGAAATNEQDSPDDVATCATVVASCPIGFRVERADFGIPDPTFAQGAPDGDAVHRAISRWEPRADTTVTVTADPNDPTAYVIEAVVAPTEG